MEAVEKSQPRNKKLRTSTIARRNAEIRDKDSDEAKVERAQNAVIKLRRYSKLTDAVARSDHYVRNEPIPFGKELFPEEWQMQYAELFYALADGGPIYFDFPRAPYEIDACKRKMEGYHKKGIRYVYVTSGDDETNVLMRLDGAKRKE